jgi:hypothetical protein
MERVSCVSPLEEALMDVLKHYVVSLRGKPDAFNTAIKVDGHASMRLQHSRAMQSRGTDNGEVISTPPRAVAE